MSDPLGLFEGSGADPLGLFSSDDEDEKKKLAPNVGGNLSLPLPGQVPQPTPKKYGVGDYIEGGIEAGLNALSAIPAGIAGPIAGMASLPFTKNPYGSKEAAKEVEDVAGKVMQSMTYEPRTDKGQDMAHAVGDVFNRYLIPAAGVAHTMPPVRIKPGQPTAESVKSKMDRIEPTLEKPADPLGLFEAPRPEGLPEILPVTREGQGILRPEDAFFRDEALRKAEAERIKDMTNESQQMPLFDQSEMGRVANPYEAKLGDWRIDENGIPIKADLSMEVANLENPLQRNLWGDELEPVRNPVGQAADLHAENGMQQGIPLTEAIDSMPWAQRRGAVRRELMHDIEAPGNLQEAIHEAARDVNEHGMPDDMTSPSAERQIIEFVEPQPKPRRISKGYRGKQSGAVDISLLADAADAIVNRISKFATGKNSPKFDLPPTGKDVMDRMHPAIANATKDVIPTPDTIDVMKPKILSEKDGPSIMSGLQSGAINTANKFRSSLIEAVGRWNLYAEKKADYAVRHEIYPVEQAVRVLKSEDVEILAHALKKEMFKGERMTTEQMKNAGMSDKTIAAYEKLRTAFDNSLTKLNEGRAAMGKDPITPKEAYLSSRWNGDWHVPIYDKEGKIVWYIRERSRGEANKALAYLKKNGPADLDLTNSKVTYRRSTMDPNSPKDMASAYKEFIDLLDKDDPKVQELQSLYEDLKQSDAYDFMNTKKHFLQKSNVHGFIGDQPWKSGKEQANELMRSQFQYLKETQRWAELQKSMVEIKKFLADPEIQAAQPNNIKYAQDYIQNTLGFGIDRAVGVLESKLAEKVGRSRSDFYRWNNTLKSAFYLDTLGGSVGYTIFSPVQAALSIANHRLLTTQGLKHNVFKTTALSLSDTMAGILKHFGSELTSKDVPLPMSKVGKEALKYAEDNGIVSHDMFDENMALGMNPAVQAARQTLGLGISVPEKVGRLTTFMSFVHHLEQSGKYASRADLFQKAEDLTNEVMVDFRRSERPMLFNKAGILGESVVPLKGFLFSYYNQLGKHARMAASGTATPLAAFLLAQYTMGGLQNMPFMNEADGSWRLLKKMLPMEAFAAVKDVPGPKESMISNMPDWAAYGPISSLSGVNFASRANVGMLDMDSPLGSMFPVPSMVGKLGGDIYDVAKHHDKTALTQLAYDVAPPTAKGYMETHGDAFKNQWDKNLDGKQQYLKPSDLRSQEASGPRRTPEQDKIRSLGLRDLKDARERDINYTSRANESLNKKYRESAMDAMFNAIVNKDQPNIDKYAKLYAVDFEGADSFERDLNRKIQEYTVNPEMRQMLKKQGIASLMAIKRRQERLQGNQ